MPELPEVETIRLGLERYLVGKIIEDVEIRLSKIFTGDKKNIIGAKIGSVERLGKALVINLDNGYSIAIHIKLTGQLIYRGPEVSNVSNVSKKIGGELPNKWTHTIFKLRAQSLGLRASIAYLYYNDIRQFGWIRIVQSEKLKVQSFFKELGHEPFKDLSLEKFKEILSKSRVAIKPLIMDQKKISGIGNIYANDALFDSQIDPRRSAKQISPEEIKRLYASLLKVLKKGLENGGASELNYVNALGQEGKYQLHFLVYGKKNKNCVRCKSVIKKIALGGRGTYLCPNCQK
jgi:formamidopyrimidine-DNA glycosylase